MYANFDEIAPWAEEWDAFVERSGGDIYSTFDWCRTWWEFYGGARRLFVCVVRQGDETVAIFPCFTETLALGGVPLRTVRIIGCDHSVATCNVVIRPGAEDAAVEAFSRVLSERHRQWDVVRLAPLPGYESRAEAVVEAAKSSFTGTRVHFDDHCGPHIVFDLAGTFEEHLAKLSANERAYFRKRSRQIAKECRLLHRVSTSAGDVRESFGRLVDMHSRQWECDGRLGHFGDWPRAREFHESLLERLLPLGRAGFFETRACGDVLTSFYLLNFGRRTHAYLGARDVSDRWRKYTLGKVGLLWFLEVAIASDATLLDAMRGYYDYKIKAGGTLLSLKAITIVKKSIRARTSYLLFRAARWVLHKGYYRLWFARLAPKLGLLRGPLWRLWIRSRM